MKKTKKSLVLSIITLLLCSCMFIGSTFAWFTDTVSNTGNKIQAGTLKVGLEQYKANPEGTAGAGGQWVDISGSENPVFNYSLWEPGYSQYAVLRVRNNGTLALKYKLLLNVNGTLVLNDKGYSIADAIDVYGFTTTNETLATIAYGETSFAEFEAIEGVTDLGTLSSLLFDEDGAAYGVLLPDGASDAQTSEVVGSAYAVLCLHMREEAGNEYQGMALGTSFDITLNATQYTYEKDGFNSKNYDELADGNPDHPEFDNPTYPVTKLPIKTIVQEGGETEVTQEQTIVLPSGMTIKYPAGVPLTTEPITDNPGNSTNKADQGFEFKNETAATPEVTNIIINDSNKAVAHYELTLPIKDTNDKLVKTSDKIVAGYINLKVYHNGTEIQKVEDPNATPTQESFYYNPETGDFTLWVFHSSPIEFVYDKEYVTPYLVTWLNNLTDTITGLEEEVDLTKVSQSDLDKGGVTNAKFNENGDLYIIIPGRKLSLFSWGENKFKGKDVYLGCAYDSTINYSDKNYSDLFSLSVFVGVSDGDTHFGCFTAEGNMPSSFDKQGSAS